MLASSDIADMTVVERLQAMELLWRSISPDEVDSPAWHGEVLSRRLEKVEAGQATFLSISQLKNRLSEGRR